MAQKEAFVCMALLITMKYKSNEVEAEPRSQSRNQFNPT